jgi:hypothetical protein
MGSAQRPLRSQSTGNLAPLWLFAAACFATLALGVGFHVITGLDRQFYVLAPLMLAGLFSLLAYNARVSRIDIWPDRVEVSNAIRNRAFPKADIVGYRRSLFRGKIVLVLKTFDRKRTRTIRGDLTGDPVLAEFLNGIPYLDAALENNSALGDTLEARRDYVRAIRWRALFLNSLGYLTLIVWLALMLAGDVHALFWQITATAFVVAAIAAPFVAIAVSFAARNLPLLSLRRDDSGASITPLLASSGVLALSALADVNILDWDKTLLYSAALAALLLLLLFVVDRRTRIWAVFSDVVTIFALYAYGTVTETNTILDRGRPQVFQAKVLAKDKHDRLYHVTVGPWGPFPQGGEIGVFEGTYADIRVGQKADIYLCPGFYGIRYYDIGSC